MHVIFVRLREEVRTFCTIPLDPSPNTFSVSRSPSAIVPENSSLLPEPLLSPHSFTRATSRIILAVAFASMQKAVPWLQTLPSSPLALLFPSLRHASYLSLCPPT